MAFMLLEPQCPLSMATLTNGNGTEVRQLLDSDPMTCLTLGANAKPWVQISLPYIRIRGTLYMSLIGNLRCSPMFGLSVSIIGAYDTST